MADLEWVRKIYDDGMHNMTTDIAFWKGRYYVCFHNAYTHVSPEGKVIVLVSDDLEHWNVAGVPINTIGDDRDPHFAVTDDRLFIYSGTLIVREGETTNVGEIPPRDLWTFCCYTDDGVEWSDPVVVYKKNNWLWAPVAFEDAFYCVSYLDCPLENREDWRALLVRSENGINWEYVGSIIDHHTPTESALRMLPDGSMQAVIRNESDEIGTFLGRSSPPFSEWETWGIEETIQSPEIVEVGGRAFVAGRSFTQSPNGNGRVARTSLWRLGERDVEHVITVPSGGDTAYPGLIASDDGSILMSYYSKHTEADTMDPPEHPFISGPAHIYLAKIRP